MPWDAYEHIRHLGTLDLAWAFALHECEEWNERHQT